MPRYLLNVLIGFDCFCNALLGGEGRETMSSRIGRYLRTNSHTWVGRLPWPAWLRAHFLSTDDRAPH